MTATELVIDGLSLHPYTYEEHEDNGGTVVTARVTADRLTRNELERKLQYYGKGPGTYCDVRTGIQDAPRQMGFGGCFWSEHGASTKYDLTLVERVVDDSHRPIPNFYPDLPNLRREVAMAGNLMSGLLESLVQSGTLSAEGKSAIEERAKAGLWQRQWSLFKLDDIDDL